MPEKAANLSWLQKKPNPIVHHWLKLTAAATLLGILLLWNNTTGLNLLNPFRNNSLAQSPLESQKDSIFNNLSSEKAQPAVDLNLARRNPAKPHVNLDSKIAAEPLAEDLTGDEVDDSRNPSTKPSRLVPWISSDFEANYSSYLLARWLEPGGEPCKDSKTADVTISGLDDGDGDGAIQLSAGDIHEFTLQTLDETGSPRCQGGDYFETDLSGEKWKSRPPVKDFGNGTYSFSLQIHPDFAGEYNLTIILLFRHYEGLKFSPQRFAVNKTLRKLPINFLLQSPSPPPPPQLKHCEKPDYQKTAWSGRWTRHAKNETCPINHDGRYRCLDPNLPCPNPWCTGPLGSLESNGWVYSAHCSFKLFRSEEAWKCLNGRWIFWWGDSNHCDTIRNILHFILNAQEIATVPRLFDANITNPRNPSQAVRFTSIFNGHHNHTGNYQGLNSLADDDYRELLKGYFSGNSVPDAIIMNSGLHDGVYWSSLRNFVKGADYAASFWAEVVEGIKKRGLKPPEVIYRTTVATGGYARSLAFNPEKMEAFNGVVLDKLRRRGILGGVVDDFDMTFPWHFDNRCNDGVHYGRAPLKMRWRDGEIGHQYFVDLMLGHVLLDALCVR